MLRAELESCPTKFEKDDASNMIKNIVKDIDMKLLAEPHVYFVEYPRYNEGLTAIAPIETSHIAFHFWTRPDVKILHNDQSKSLLQFDVYTCGTLSVGEIKKILKHITPFVPTHCDVTILNRIWDLSVNKHLTWDIEKDMSWNDWLKSKQFS